MGSGPAGGVYRPEGISVPVLRGRWSAVARVAWVGVAGLCAVLLVSSLAGYYQQALALTAPALRDPDAHGMGSPETIRAALRALGLSVPFYAAYSTALFVLNALVFMGVGLAIFLRRPSERMALIVSLWLVMFGATFTPATWSLQSISPVLYAVGSIVGDVSYAGLFLMFYVFPDGRFVPRWTRWCAALLIWLVLFSSLLPGTALDPNSWGVVNLFLLVALFASMLFAQAYRYVRVSTLVQRQQTKWATFGLSAAITGFFLLLGLIPGLFPELNQPGPTGLLYDLVSSSLVVVGFALIPVSIGLAILRHRLWDINVILNRALVYGGLTVGVVGMYALVVGGLGLLLEARGSWLPSLFAAGLIAVVFAPVRDRLQRGVNRLTYGDRDDPYRVISRLGERLETALAPDAVLPVIVQTVGEALKLPYAAVVVTRDGGADVAAEAGMPVHDPIRLPLVYQGEAVGELLLAPRAGEDRFSAADSRLLTDLARQAGVAVHAVRLTADLQRSRETLVTAREEERRRLRRDLHDGLGPALAAQTLKVGVARAVLRENPDTAERLMEQLEADIESSLSNVRRLVYALRPPSLDELGLLGAIREQASQFSGQGGGKNGPSRIAVETPDVLPPMPAAVEVAAYRIVQEALTNVVRHANARSCTVRITWKDALEISIADDGVGLPPGSRAGVGLMSMRERAEELGGSCKVDSRPGGGTTVTARLPVGDA